MKPHALHPRGKPTGTISVVRQTHKNSTGCIPTLALRAAGMEDDRRLAYRVENGTIIISRPAFEGVASE